MTHSLAAQIAAVRAAHDKALDTARASRMRPAEAALYRDQLAAALRTLQRIDTPPATRSQERSDG